MRNLLLVCRNQTDDVANGFNLHIEVGDTDDIMSQEGVVAIEEHMVESMEDMNSPVVIGMYEMPINLSNTVVGIESLVNGVLTFSRMIFGESLIINNSDDLEVLLELMKTDIGSGAEHVVITNITHLGTQ